MSRGPGRGFAPPAGDAGDVGEDVRHRSVPELLASLRSSASGPVAFEGVRKVLEVMQRRSSREIERLRSENESFRNELERLNSERLRLEGEVRKCRTDGDESAEAERPAGIAERVYGVRAERGGRGGGGGGGGGASLEEIYDELRRKNEELEGEKRELESWLQVWRKKYEELDKLQLERDASVLKNEERCILGGREGESAVLGETDGLINVDVCGDSGDSGCARRGHDSKDGGTVSFARNARKKLGFGAGACLSPSAGSTRKSPVKKDGVLQGDGSFLFVEVSDNADNCSRPSGDKHPGRRNDEKGNRELKGKRGPLPTVLGETCTQTLRDMAVALKQCKRKRIKEKDSDNSLSKSTRVNPIKHESGAGSKSDYGSSEQKRIKERDSDDSLSKSTGVNPIKHKNRAGSASAKSDSESSDQKRIKEKDSDNSLSKSTGVNLIKHENRAASASAKSDYGSSLHKERWNSEADMLLDFTQDDELCMKAVCALYRWQRSKSMQRTACGGFNDLLSPRENSLAEFLMGGDPEGKLKKSVMNLRDHCPEGPILCRSAATIHFKQLFVIYRMKEDPFFPSS
ncbi:hypothetical protein EUGRSUZ_E00841 [Eucalyptus grandis]|uniref:Uncharacterized protein n=2 Tax=Eucalyptus grandis TaxID=71139 RepID=A0A059C2H3_EUCGR|nr:hypothetical protein EUGRSUZ_E00841 [Eucalyptus grandis]